MLDRLLTDAQDGRGGRPSAIQDARSVSSGLRRAVLWRSEADTARGSRPDASGASAAAWNCVKCFWALALSDESPACGLVEFPR